MVSLSSIEEELLRFALQKGWTQPKNEGGPSLAIAVSESNGDKPLIVVFTTFEVSKEALNDALRESGFGRIIKIADVKKLDQIPLSGAGKVHYSALEEML